MQDIIFFSKALLQQMKNKALKITHLITWYSLVPVKVLYSTALVLCGSDKYQDGFIRSWISRFKPSFGLYCFFHTSNNY